MKKGYMGAISYKTDAFSDEMKSWFNVCYIDGRILEDGEYSLTLYPFKGDKLRCHGKLEDRNIKNGKCYFLMKEGEIGSFSLTQKIKA
jgi:hypothetical protein